MAFAGIWSSWKDPEGGEWVRTCSILTTEAAGDVRRIHDRMPVILAEEVWDAWLDREMTDPDRARGLLRAIDSELLMEHAVSRQVNSVRNDGPDLIAPDPHAG
jgi:putative SOS response-associated peptidase YedK